MEPRTWYIHGMNNDRVRKLIQPPILMLWRMYYVLFPRTVAIKHWIKGDISFSRMLLFVLPGGLKPRRIDGTETLR